MTYNRYEPVSIAPDDSVVETGPRGQRAHREAIAHGELYEPKLWACGEHAWCMVGNGLSNQTFIEGPEGIIAIDTGESIQEMACALRELRKVNTRPVVAVIYSHFHYVGGTTALKDDPYSDWPQVPVWAHAGVPGNRQRVSGEFGPAAQRGLVFQFGLSLPAEGEDAMLNSGLGRFFHNPDHAPFTNGYAPPTHLFDEPVQVRLAGLDVEMVPAPSDSNDSATIWFPALRVCVNNLLWPCLFNVYPIRGEPYRDPTVLIHGLEQMLCLPADHMLGAHGPPLAGVDIIEAALTDYRDSIQFMWDQTVRGLNLGLTGPEIAHSVKLPEHFQRRYLTRQMYGLMEHHLRQIRNGLVGWFDGDESTLFALPTGERAARMIQGFGGRAAVRAQAQAAIAASDLRWALELSSWLVRADPGSCNSGKPDGARDLNNAPGAAAVGECEALDRELMGQALRCIAQRTTAQNLRNWCLTRAREVEGSLDLKRFRQHRFRARDVLENPPAASVTVLRVMLVPEQALGVEDELAWCFDDGATVGLRIRSLVAVPTHGRDAPLRLRLSLATWAGILADKQGFFDAVAQGVVRVEGDLARVRRVLACFEHPALTR